MLKLSKPISRTVKLLLTLTLLTLITACKSTSNSGNNDFVVKSAKEITIEMGTGFNLGNTFENGYNNTDPVSNIQIIQLYRSVGMNHIRIPVTWMDSFGGDHLADEDGNVEFTHPRFVELKSIIDFAIDKDMYVVLNAHHEHWLNNNYDGTETYDAKFRNLWTNIATYFNDYDQRLIFEVLNEPQGNFGEWGGAIQPNSAQGLLFTRKINNVAYTAIRDAGGNNDIRIIQVGTNGMGNHTQLDDVYPTKESLPGGGNDQHLVASVHSYDPWEFCGQDGSNSAYPGASVVENSIREVAAHAVILDIPLNYSEWGVGRNGNTAERNTDLVREHYRLMRLTMLDVGAATTPWDDRGWFGLITKVNGVYAFGSHNIVPYMMAE